MTAPSLEPIGLNRPNAARMYDYFLGGSHNFPIDRQAAETALAGFPGLAAGMRANRAFLRRAVRFLVSAGVDQFLDLGSGIPTVGNVHDIAQQINPDARVVYVDIEPIAVAHSYAMLAENDRAFVVQADLRRPAEVLATPEVRGLFDLQRPIGVLLVGVVHFIPDADDPQGIVGQYRDAITPGSYVAVTNAAIDESRVAENEAAKKVYASTPTPLTFRSREAVAGMLDGLTPVEPGVVELLQWRPDSGDELTVDPSFSPFAYAGVGLKETRP
jgi:hypothetical protein